MQVQARGARGSDEAHYQRAYRVVGASTVGGGANAADALLTGLPRLADEPFIHMGDGGLAYTWSTVGLKAGKAAHAHTQQLIAEVPLRGATRGGCR